MRANLYLTTILSLGALSLAACGDARETADPVATAPSPETGGDMSDSSPARASSNETGTADLMNNDGDSIGTVSLTQAPTGLLLRVEAEGLETGWHGIHIHAVGDCSDAAFESAGSHINHAQAPHGLLNPEGPDDGDLPNVHASEDGRVRAELFTTSARIADNGPGQWLWDGDGSAVVVHTSPDDHRSQPIGGAGDRVACAVISRG
jgi:superoxide dismutase, Cu-Zn family